MEDPRAAQKVFKDFQRGHDVKDIAKTHGMTTRAVNQTVKFESAVHARVQETMAKQAKAQERKVTRPVTKSAAKPAGRKK